MNFSFILFWSNILTTLWLWPLCTLCVINHSTVFYSPIFSYHLQWFAIINGVTNDTVEHNGIIIDILLYLSNFMFAKNWIKRRWNEWNCEHDWAFFSIRIFLNECDNQTKVTNRQRRMTISKSMKFFLVENGAVRCLDYIHLASRWFNAWYFDIIIISCWIKISLSLSIHVFSLHETEWQLNLKGSIHVLDISFSPKKKAKN